jgi:membrane fusion protein (multidrug efflux system)
MNKLIRITLVSTVAAAIAAAGAYYWLQSSKTQSTENAYVNADIVQIASQLTGPVTQVYVREGQLVKAGQPLFDIDAAPLEVALAQAQAKLAEATQGVRQDQTDVHATEATVAQAQADLNSAKANARRTDSLVQSKFLSAQANDDATVKVKLAEAGVMQARAKLMGAQTHVASVGGTNGATPAVLAARAELEQAQLNLTHSHVVASKDGWITNLSLVPGTTVSTGAPLFALISQGSFWVDANFKETELPGIVIGQSAELELDMLPGQTFHGVVESIGNGTGAAFSLLPAQNATGNWVKVAQRVPVRVRFTDLGAAQVLRVGASAHVTVHIKN